MENKKRLEELDKKYIWHPFTQMKDWEAGTPTIIEEGSGCRIKDIDGNWYLDGVSSIWVNIHGHRRKEIDDAVREQIGKISHSTLLGLSNVPAIKLAERIIGIMGRSFNCRGNPLWLPSSGRAQQVGVKTEVPSPTKVFYSDNGSTAVEVALKMAFQYWIHKGVEGKSSFLSLTNAYHGDTLGAVSVGGVDIFHKVFGPLLFKTFKSPSPYCYRCEFRRDPQDCGSACVNEMEDILKKHHHEIAGLIIEPLVQAAGGMIVFPEGYLKAVRDLCSRYGVLMIADEIATGFGRTGRMFACEHESVVPDIICLSKGITGGYLPLAVTLATEEIYNAFLGDFKELKTFFHGHSYTGNPLACAAALACLDIFEKEDTLKRIQPMISLFEERLAEISGLDHVGEARNKGLMAGIELVKDKNTGEPCDWEEKMGWRVANYAKEKGLFIRPIGNVIIIMPPLCISKEELKQMLDIIEEGIGAVT
jgi:adenosylmethionine-8-amino-7-oxononanoate aminotransferase